MGVSREGGHVDDVQQTLGQLIVHQNLVGQLLLLLGAQTVGEEHAGRAERTERD